ncbi:hypothetical protein DMUE_1471 [Dictyocoela muelleri]|nr:hypothetical protein DMUE_1471 [Dictyocoela muelleri]
MSPHKHFFIPLFEETLKMTNIGKELSEKLVINNTDNKNNNSNDNNKTEYFYNTFLYKIGLLIKNIKKDSKNNYIITCDSIFYYDIPIDVRKVKIGNVSIFLIRLLSSINQLSNNILLIVVFISM